MVRIRKSTERGRSQHGWLDSRHTFSFADYYDPKQMGFRSLRVLNEDRVRPGAGFGEHPHQDMEIISYVLDGALTHRDSMGNVSTLTAGDVQVMTAGSGVRHSEWNPSVEEPTHFLQIWVMPEGKGLSPSYEQRHVDEDEKGGRLALIASPARETDGLTIHQDVSLYATVLRPGERVQHQMAPGRHAWVQIIDGRVTVNGHALEAGDGTAISEESEVAIAAETSAEALLFDLA
jgi:redox-sensitive bicupin YhaK (pirin superfamily)